jgi:soluble lytic murein transglycosylase-like protein
MFNPILLVSLLASDPQTLSSIIDEHAKIANIDPRLMVAIAYHESRFDPKAVSDVKKDYGVFQIRFGAATRGFKLRKKDLLDPEINTVLSILYMRDQLDRCKTTARALGAYSSGRCHVNSYSKIVLRTYHDLKNPRNNVTKRIVYEKLFKQDQKMLSTTHNASKNDIADPFSLNQVQLQDSL